MTTNSERIKRYRQRMKQKGFVNIGAMVSSELYALLANERQPNECTGRVLERLILGASYKRPKHKRVT
ncbi:hypothetical protein [Deefgea rivuli]|uniref:hypothetical protein n=1 Tax=Deefgea rivuli TaxID=400948 RepID=UPI000684DF95|nr:hypothetical protein [Deefgea rivuli]